MAGYNLPDNVSYHDPRAPWNATQDDEIRNICEDALGAVRTLYDLLAELRDIDRRWFFRQFKLAYKHDSPLSMLDESEGSLMDAMDDILEKPMW